MRGLRILLALCGLVSAFVLAGGASAHTRTARHRTGNSLIKPSVSEWQFLSSDSGPPSEAACNAVGRRCFNPTAMANSYDYAGLHATDEGQGKTIAIIDSFGTTTIRQDLADFDTAFGLPRMCGEGNIPSNPSGNCPAGAPGPHFNIVCFQGCPTPAPPPASSSTYQQAKNGWALEVSLDVEWAHATAPMANIMLVTTPVAETQGVQGLQQMMHAEQYVVDNHMADVITQSFGTGEANFGAGSLKQLRQAFIDAQANHVSVFASSGDGGTTNNYKTPVKNPSPIPYPSVGYPASDPLVTSVGGTYLCTNPVTGSMTADEAFPPARCTNAPGDREPGWVDSGGGYSIFFSKPAYQDALPPGSTFVGSSPGAPPPNSDMRGVPDVAYQASAATGVLVRLTEPYPPGSTTTGGGGANPPSSGWWVVGGTSSGSPQWAGIAAMADEMAGRDLGFLNPGLYAVANNPTMYAKDFYDVTAYCNQTSSIPGYCASKGWDAVTGLGTPDVANLIPDLIAATP